MKTGNCYSAGVTGYTPGRRAEKLSTIRIVIANILNGFVLLATNVSLTNASSPELSKNWVF